MQNARKKMMIGVIFTLLGGILWGVSGTSVQYLTTTGASSPAMVTFLRILFGGGIFVLFSWFTKRNAIKAMFKDLKTFGALMLFALSLYGNQLCYAQTVQITNAGTATVLQMLGSVFVMIFVCLETHKLPRIKEFTGLLLAIIATVLIATQGDLGSLNIPLDGLIWGILTGLTTAIYILVPKQTGLFARFGSAPVVGVGMFLGVVFALPVYLLQGGSLGEYISIMGAYGIVEWLVFCFGLVIVGTICGYGFYLHGVSIVGSVKGALLGAIEPVSATVISALWLKTVFTGFDISGMVLMCIMVAFVTTDDSAPKEAR